MESNLPVHLSLYQFLSFTDSLSQQSLEIALQTLLIFLLDELKSVLKLSTAMIEQISEEIALSHKWAL